MKVKFTAEIIDDDGNVVGKRTSEEGGIPSMETFDISTKEGFLRDFDLLEKAVLKARNQVGSDAADEILTGAIKKRQILGAEKGDNSRVRAWQDSRLPAG